MLTSSIKKQTSISAKIRPPYLCSVFLYLKIILLFLIHKKIAKFTVFNQKLKKNIGNYHLFKLIYYILFFFN